MGWGCPQPQLLEPLDWTRQHPSLRLTVDIEHDVPAVLAHRTHGHAGVAARVRGPGTGQGEDPAPRKDLHAQEEADVNLGTSGGSTHTSPVGSRPQSSPQCRGTWNCAQTKRPLLAGGQMTSVPQKSPLEQCYS